MSSPSPLVLVNGQSPINGINVAAGSTVTVALQDPSGVNAWSLQCTDTDGYVLASTINGSVSLDIVTKTATFTMPNYASSVLMQSTVNNGIGFSGAQDDALTIKFKVSVLTSANLRLGAMNERYENNLATGYTGLINDAIKAIGMFGGSFTAGGDLDGSSTNQTVVAIQGRAVSNAAPSVSNLLGWNGSSWAPTAAFTFAAGGDVTGSSGSLTVVKIQGRPMDVATPATGNVIAWNGTSWAPTAPASGFTAGGDLTGSSTNQTVAKVNGITITGTPAVGNQLRATSSTAASYAALNLAGGSGYVTGILPAANVGGVSGITVSGTPSTGQALIATSTTAANWQTISGSTPTATTTTTGTITLAGDMGGTAAAPSVLKINGTSVPATPTANTFLKASSGTAATWAAIDRIQAVVVSGTAPTSGQVLTASSGTAASWVTPSGTSVTWATDLVGSTNSSQIVTAATGSAGVFNIKCAEIANSSVAKITTRDYNLAQFTTTNATTATAYTIVTTTNSQTDIAIRMNATRNTYASGGNWTMQLTVRNVAGALTLVGSLAKSANKDIAGFDLDYTFSGATVNIRVTGAAATNLAWQGTCSTMQTQY